MDNTNEPNYQAHSDRELPSIADKVSALERQIAGQQDQLRDYEKSLVERIADVDDDRRMTASKLARAWQTQREQINDRMGRQTAITVAALILFVIVLGAVLFLAYRQAELGRQPPGDDLAEVKQEVGRTSGKPAEGDLERDELTRLSAAVNEISSSLGRLDEEQASRLKTVLEGERSARDEADSRIGAEVRRLKAEQRRLTRELESLREALEAARAKEAAPSAGGGSPERSAEPGSAQEPAAAIAEPPRETGATPSAARPSTSHETSVAAAEQPVGDAEQEVDDEDLSADTPETAFVIDRTYALQLISFFDREALLRFADRDDLPERLYYRKEDCRGRPCFVLIHSVHKDYASAEAELHRLSPDLIAIEPWIRPIREGVELKKLETGAVR